MTAFDDALAVLVTDVNLSVAAEYRVAGAGPATELRVIVSQPDELAVPFDTPAVRPTRVLTARIADLPTLRAGDTFTIGDDLLTALAPRRDAEGVTWTIPCR